MLGHMVCVCERERQALEKNKACSVYIKVCPILTISNTIKHDFYAHIYSLKHTQRAQLYM